MIQTRTQGIIHFEDLDPRIFEKMCLDLLVASKEYKDFKTYGVKAYDAWCKHLLPKGFVENFVAFRKAFTLAWSRSKCTDHDDPDFIKHYHELDFERFIRLTSKR